MWNYWLFIHPNFQIPRIGIWGLTTKKRLVIEQYLIRLHTTYQPFGLNILQKEYPDSPTVQFVIPYSGLATKASKWWEITFRICKKNYRRCSQKPWSPQINVTKNTSDMVVSSKTKINTIGWMYFMSLAKNYFKIFSTKQRRKARPFAWEAGTLPLAQLLIHFNSYRIPLYGKKSRSNFHI